MIEISFNLPGVPKVLRYRLMNVYFVEPHWTSPSTFSICFCWNKRFRSLQALW